MVGTFRIRQRILGGITLRLVYIDGKLKLSLIEEEMKAIKKTWPQPIEIDKRWIPFLVEDIAIHKLINIRPLLIIESDARRTAFLLPKTRYRRGGSFFSLLLSFPFSPEPKTFITYLKFSLMLTGVDTNINTKPWVQATRNCSFPTQWW